MDKLKQARIEAIEKACVQIITNVCGPANRSTSDIYGEVFDAGVAAHREMVEAAIAKVSERWGTNPKTFNNGQGGKRALRALKKEITNG